MKGRRKGRKGRKGKVGTAVPTVYTVRFSKHKVEGTIKTYPRLQLAPFSVHCSVSRCSRPDPDGLSSCERTRQKYILTHVHKTHHNAEGPSCIECQTLKTCVKVKYIEES